MIVSSPNNFASAGSFSLTPAMLRGIYLIWRSELQRGQFAEIRNLDDNKCMELYIRQHSGYCRMLCLW